jgi:hypothetical protein
MCDEDTHRCTKILGCVYGSGFGQNKQTLVIDILGCGISQIQ